MMKAQDGRGQRADGHLAELLPRGRPIFRHVGVNFLVILEI